MKRIVNCHAIGLHSLVLQESPMIRLFVTTEDHELWRNTRDNIAGMSVGFHAHHCDLTLTLVRGVVANWLVAEDKLQSWQAPWISRGACVGKFRYHSKLRGEKPGFERLGETRVTTLLFSQMNSPWAMKASMLHTVFAPKGERAAWLVHEGQEDPNYEPFTYSGRDLTQLDMSNLYKPMPYEFAQELLNWSFGQYDHLRKLA